MGDDSQKNPANESGRWWDFIFLKVFCTKWDVAVIMKTKTNTQVTIK
jgi:hypothetical protein